ncbi:hypothetical protein JTE90_024644 [Oedothorax gibbosus]|uniref:limulus clotting factor C n=1 Tax=Oedothorax gibbosus TaxID=931172 RepID=A0AAV6U2Y9_9ARAC|nr:hypothetical protein JTE90_024644 [Oedothorax gibbosus]
MVMIKIVLLTLVFLITISEAKDFECNPNLPIVFENVTVNERGYLYSAGFKTGKPYPSDIRCRIRITSPENTYIRLQFNTVDLAPSFLCVSDRLDVLNVAANDLLTASGTYCGNPPVPDLVSKTNRILIHFRTGIVGTGRGYNISYTVTTNPKLCAETEFECRNRKCLPKLSLTCDGKDDCGDGSDEEYCGWNALPGKDCGVPEVQPVIGFNEADRIVGGREARRGSWPWQVDLQDATYLTNGHICGGTLLNTEWFVTAAHCLMHHRMPFSVRVHLGNHHRYKTDPYEQIRYIKDYEVYGVKKADFFRNGVFNFTHDIALAKLNSPVTLSPHVQTACLPHSNETLSVGQKCFVTGWGMTRGSGSDDVLKQVEQIIQPYENCNNIFVKFENTTMICAGRMEPLYGICNGDSGGPLVCQRDGRWYVHGAVSAHTDSNFIWGICGLADRPSIYAKVSAKVDWIKSVILNH